MGFLTRLMDRMRKAFAVLIGKEQPAAPAAPPKPARPATLSARPGVKCPRCTCHIEVSIPVLLSGMPLQCPACALQLNVHPEKSADSLSALRKLQGDFDIAAEQMKAATGHG